MQGATNNRSNKKNFNTQHIFPFSVAKDAIK